MPDSTVILNWVQTLGVVAALSITAYEMWRRRKEQHFRNYLDGIAGFIDDTKLLVERPELQALYDYSEEDIHATAYSDLSDAQKSRVHYCDSIIARCETVWLAAKERWVTPDEWIYWKRWVRQLGKSPDFRWTVQWVADDYSEEFIALVREEIGQAMAHFETAG